MLNHRCSMVFHVAHFYFNMGAFHPLSHIAFIHFTYMSLREVFLSFLDK